MARPEYRGRLPCGRIVARFSSDSGNEDPDLLILGFAPTSDGAPRKQRSEAAPGGSASVELEVAEDGMIEVMVATGYESDGGHLEVWYDDTLKHGEDVSGSVHWVYAIGS